MLQQKAAIKTVYRVTKLKILKLKQEYVTQHAAQETWIA